MSVNDVPARETRNDAVEPTVPKVAIPRVLELMWPTLCSLRALGGVVTNREIYAETVRREGYSEEQQSVLQGNGPKTKIAYHLEWTRTVLKYGGLIDNPERGSWTVTEDGITARPEDMDPLYREYYASRSGRGRRGRNSGEPSADGTPTVEPNTDTDPTDTDPDDSPEASADGADWHAVLLDTLLSMTPAAFEQLAERLLRAAGFVNTKVTGRSGDEGIDGVGVYQLSLLSFPVFFQCKRYRESVGSPAVRNFRGAMQGRGDKGLLITTGTFTQQARDEATRAGASPIDLIDGDQLCELIKQHGMGVETRIRQVEDVIVDPEYFRRL
ncbi:restriction endonuclease [Streptomyces sp. NPDC059002]|uniref:restriction endonuclease n=1 Tax=Streptomyces sp. NPDC059002 TaxID=3346690 RepID=UPI0036C2EB30